MDDAGGVGKGTEYTQKSVSKYETESLDLNTHTIVALCRFFEVSADYLLGLTDEY